MVIMEKKENKKVVMGRIAKSRIIIFSMLCVLLLTTSCEQRDPQAEFELLQETVFTTPKEGEAKAQEYIDYFYNKDGARITEVSEMRHQYREMDEFCSKSFSSYGDFIKESRELNNELSRSNYTGVRKMWFALYTKGRDRLLGPLLDGITASDFDTFFVSQVRLLCENEFSYWEIDAIDQVTLSTPTLNEDGTAKKALGEYRVHLSGKFGLIKPTAEITIEGTIGPNVLGYVTPVRTSYKFTKKPIL